MGCGRVSCVTRRNVVGMRIGLGGRPGAPSG